jgi:hypothetical protein
VESQAPVAADRVMRRFSMGRAPLRIAASRLSVARRWSAFAASRLVAASRWCSVAQSGAPVTRESWRRFVLAVDAAEAELSRGRWVRDSQAPHTCGKCEEWARAGQSPRPLPRGGPAGRQSQSRSPGGQRQAQCQASRAGGTATPIGVTATDRRRRSVGISLLPPRGGGRPRPIAGPEGPPMPPQPRRIPRSRPHSGAPPSGGS